MLSMRGRFRSLAGSNRIMKL